MNFFDGSTHSASAVVMKMQVLTTSIRFPFAYEARFLPLPLPNRADSQRNCTQRTEPIATSKRQCVQVRSRLRHESGSAAAIAPKAVTPESLNWKFQIGEAKLESPDLQVTASESKHLVLVTRLKTSVTWAKSTKLVTLTVKPFAFGHNL